MNARWIIVLICGSGLLIAGCQGSSPDELKYRLSDQTKLLPEEQQTVIEGALFQHFGTPARPVVMAKNELELEIEGASFDSEHLKKGAAGFRRLCMHCHGLSGDGMGPTAPFLNPRPRDYRAGRYKFASTKNGSKPMREDLMRTLNNGVPGTSMPSFKLEDPEELQAVLDYVLVLSFRGQVEQELGYYLFNNLFTKPEEPEDPSKADLAKLRRQHLEALASEIGEDGSGLDEEELTTDVILESVELVFGQWMEAADNVVEVEGDVPSLGDPESVERGRNLYTTAAAQCASCHGTSGTGDGTQIPTDSWFNVARPANLRRGLYRGGGRPEDLWRRVQAGIEGSAMPGFGNTLPLTDALLEKHAEEEKPTDQAALEAWRAATAANVPEDEAIQDRANSVWDLVCFVRSLALTSTP